MLKKMQFTNESDYLERLKTTPIAGGGMIVPAALQQKGLRLAVVATGVQELRPTKDSTEENPKFYGATEVETSDGLRFFVLNTTWYAKSTPLTIEVSETKNETTGKTQFGFVLIGSGVKKGTKVTA